MIDAVTWEIFSVMQSLFYILTSRLIDSVALGEQLNTNMFLSYAGMSDAKSDQRVKIMKFTKEIPVF